MYRKTWKECHSAICSISFLNGNNIKTSFFTGFKVNHYLITDESIYQVDHADFVEIRFVGTDGFTITQSVIIPVNDFYDRIIEGSQAEDNGFAIVNIDFPEFSEIPSLKLCYEGCYQIGQSIAIFGYPVDQNNLNINHGIISSFYLNDKGIKYIQFDASIKQGYSGGPIINVETGMVIGIIGYRLVKILKTYHQIKEITANNIALLEEVKNSMFIKNIDPVQVLMANQNQIKLIAKEMFRSSYRSGGLALEINEVIKHFSENLKEEKVKKVKVKL